MYMNRTLQLAVAGIAVLASGSVFAQGFTSNAQRELNQFRTQSIGTGYTVDSTIQNQLSRVNPVFTRGQATSVTSSSLGGGSRGGPISKPFSNVSTAPTVSPYLTLFNDSLTDDFVPVYNTIVRPQLEQQRFNQRMQQQNQQLERQLQSIAAQPAFNPRGSQSMAPTGHSAVFMNTGRYYPLNNRRR